MAVALRPGDNDDLVRLLQARLNRDYPLYSNLVVDGIYGPRTTAVVGEFQRRAGLQVDGVAGPQTLGRLGLNFDQPAPLPTDRPFVYCASGTWATPLQGPLKIFTLIQSNEFLALLNLADTPENFVEVIRTATVVGDFLIRNPHLHYPDWPAFTGLTGVDRAVQIVATGPTGGP